MLSPFSLETLANANIKNRAEYTQLTTELSRLEKEKRNELRMVNNEILRFKAKYSKTNFATDSPLASNVKMYDTHNPGFCFKRNGEHRVQQTVENAPPIDFEHLHFLLFTDGEVDIEKLLCLHLLSSHETSHLTPPRRPHTGSSFTKKDSPLEQLIERSKDSTQKEEKLRDILPTYVLDIHKGNPKRTLMDERLSARLLVNEKILDLILTVVSALEHSNPEKVQHLVSLAEDTSSLKRIFRKHHIQDFVMTLKNHSLVNSCSSFILTEPWKIKPNHIEIRTPSGALEDLVRFIRTNVLQFPKRESWNMLEIESRELFTIEQNPLPSKSSKTSRKPSSIGLKMEVEKEAPREEVPQFRRRDVNYIKKNIESIPKYRKNSGEEDILSKPKRKRSSIESKTDERSSKSSVHSKNVRKSSVGSNKNDRRLSGSSAKQREPSQSETKYHIKQTTCAACMEKWKIPLPSPKVPQLSSRLNANPSLTSSDRVSAAALLKTDSRRRLSNLIEQEQFKLDSYDRKYSNTSQISNQLKKKKMQSSTSFDWVALNILDLEKIRHEIREKETNKKLEKFLGE